MHIAHVGIAKIRGSLVRGVPRIRITISCGLCCALCLGPKHETLSPVEGSPHVKVLQPHPKVEPSNHFESLRLRLRDEGLGLGFTGLRA